MTLYTSDYLDYYLTLVAWVVHNGVWAILLASGVFAIPFIVIIVQEWLRARMRTPAQKSLTEAAGLSGFAGVKLHQ